MVVEHGDRARLSAIVADRRQLIRAAISTLLLQRANILVVGEAATNREVVGLLSAATPDFLVLSAEMLETTSHDLLRQVHVHSPCTHMVVLHEGDGPAGALRAVTRAGHTVIDWNSHPAELLGNLRRHASRLRDWRRGSPSAGLSARELDVLLLVADGLSNREIGEKLSISGGTVKRHLANIFERLHAHSRVQAINGAIEIGVLDPRHGEWVHTSLMD